MDEREFDDFYTASFSRIVGQLHAMIGSRDEAQECVQEAFVRAWAHRRKLVREDDVRDSLDRDRRALEAMAVFRG